MCDNLIKCKTCIIIIITIFYKIVHLLIKFTIRLVLVCNLSISSVRMMACIIMLVPLHDKSNV